MGKWMAIAILLFMLLSYAAVNTLLSFKIDARVFKLERQLVQMQETIDILKDDGKHYLHRLNAIQYPEVLTGKPYKGRSR